MSVCQETLQDLQIDLLIDAVHCFMHFDGRGKWGPTVSSCFHAGKSDVHITGAAAVPDLPNPGATATSKLPKPATAAAPAACVYPTVRGALLSQPMAQSLQAEWPLLCMTLVACDQGAQSNACCTESLVCLLRLNQAQASKLCQVLHHQGQESQY